MNPSGEARHAFSREKKISSSSPFKNNGVADEPFRWGTPCFQLLSVVKRSSSSPFKTAVCLSEALALDISVRKEEEGYLQKNHTHSQRSFLAFIIKY